MDRPFWPALGSVDTWLGWTMNLEANNGQEKSFFGGVQA